MVLDGLPRYTSPGTTLPRAPRHPSRYNAPTNTDKGHVMVSFARSTCLVAALALLLGTLGCTRYTNIPSQKGDLAKHDPNEALVRDLEIQSLRAVMNDAPIDGTYWIVLPPNTLPVTYDKVVEQVGDNAVWSSEGEMGTPVVRVKQLRIRGTSAEVDVVRPAPGAAAQAHPALVTVNLQWRPVSGWAVNRIRWWHSGVGQEVDLTGEMIVP